MYRMAVILGTGMFAIEVLTPIAFGVKAFNFLRGGQYDKSIGHSSGSGLEPRDGRARRVRGGNPKN